MASLLYNLELSLLTHKVSTGSLHSSGDAGGVVSLLYILSRHYSVLRNRALPAVIEDFSKNWVCPGPLRHRKTRRKVFNGCRDTFCAVVGLVVLFLLCYNSAAPPSHWQTNGLQFLIGRIWKQLQTSRQAQYTLSTSSPELSSSWTHTWLLMLNIPASYLFAFDAELCR